MNEEKQTNTQTYININVHNYYYYFYEYFALFLQCNKSLQRTFSNTVLGLFESISQGSPRNISRLFRLAIPSRITNQNSSGSHQIAIANNGNLDQMKSPFVISPE